MFNAIRLRLLAWNFVVFFALLVSLGAGIYYMTARTLNGEVNAILREGAAHALRDFSATPGFPMTLPQHGYPSDVFYLSVDTSGSWRRTRSGWRSIHLPIPRACCGR